MLKLSNLGLHKRPNKGFVRTFAELHGASVINCCYAARGIRVSSTTTKTVDCPNLTFSENERSIADGKISLNVSRRIVSPAWIAGVLISRPNFNAI